MAPARGPDQVPVPPVPRQHTIGQGRGHGIWTRSGWSASSICWRCAVWPCGRGPSAWPSSSVRPRCRSVLAGRHASIMSLQ